jgi:hypothetical protein
MDILSNSVASGSPTVTKTYTILAVSPTHTATSSLRDLLIETLWATDASFMGPVTTTITVSTVTITVSAVSTSASTPNSLSVTTSVPASAHPITTLLPERCMQPGGVPLMCAQTSDENVLAPATVTTLINGSVVAITQKSAAIPLGASNLFKPIVAGFKSIFSLGVGYGKKISAQVPGVCLEGNGNLVACPSFAEQTSRNGMASATQKSAAIPLGENSLFKPNLAGFRSAFSFGSGFEEKNRARYCFPACHT